MNSTPITEINPNKDSDWKPSNSILLSTEVILALKSMTDFIDLEKFLINCRNVIIQSCNRIKQRWKFDSVPLEFTNPQNILDEKYHAHNPDLYEVLFEFPHLTNSYDDKLMADINVEWNNLTKHHFSTDVSQIKRADEFWDTVSKCVDEKGQRTFTNISRFCLDILTFPVSNAASERVWSKLTIEKNPYRSRLNFSTTRALLLSCQYLKDEGGSLFFEANEAMMIQMATNLKSKKKEENVFENEDKYFDIDLHNEQSSLIYVEEDNFVRKLYKTLTLSYENVSNQLKIEPLSIVNDLENDLITAESSNSVDNMQPENVMQTDIIHLPEDQMIIDTPDFVELAKLLCSVEKETDNDFFENGLMKKLITTSRNCITKKQIYIFDWMIH